MTFHRDRSPSTAYTTQANGDWAIEIQYARSTSNGNGVEVGLKVDNDTGSAAVLTAVVEVEDVLSGETARATQSNELAADHPYTWPWSPSEINMPSAAGPARPVDVYVYRQGEDSPRDVQRVELNDPVDVDEEIPVDEDCIWENTGEPRARYTWEGDPDFGSNDDRDFDRWRRCEITTQQFQSMTAPGNGTAALVGPEGDGGSGDDDGSCVYEKTGEPRSEYTWHGVEKDFAHRPDSRDFELWKRCQISTTQFQGATAGGNGTAALRGPGLNGDGSGGDGSDDGSSGGDSGGGSGGSYSVRVMNNFHDDTGQPYTVFRVEANGQTSFHIAEDSSGKFFFYNRDGEVYRTGKDQQAVYDGNVNLREETSGGYPFGSEDAAIETVQNSANWNSGNGGSDGGSSGGGGGSTQPASFEITNLDYPDSVAPGEQYDFTVGIENTGGSAAEAIVKAGGSSKTRSVQPGGTASVQFSFSAPSDSGSGRQGIFVEIVHGGQTHDTVATNVSIAPGDGGGGDGGTPSPTIDSDKVTVECPAPPNDPAPGASKMFSANVSNDNDTGVEAVVSMHIGPNSNTQTVRLGSQQTKAISIPLTIPTPSGGEEEFGIGSSVGDVSAW